MIIGVPKEIKNNEFRVGMTPHLVSTAVNIGHTVLVEKSAGIGINADDKAYTNAGATIVSSAKEVFAKADMIVKVKEPQAEECAMLREDQILYTYLHLAPDPEQTKHLLNSGAVCIAYETITNDLGELPLLKPMSQVAGRLSVQAGAQFLEKAHGGKGMLLGGVSGVAPAKVVIIGGGIVGFNAAQMAIGLGSEVVILDTNNRVIEKLHNYFGTKATVLHSNDGILKQHISNADLIIGGVLVTGAQAPKIITREVLSLLKQKTVLVDVAIDQGGCFETSKATTHANPVYEIDNIIHYCVANMPGAVPVTSTYALNNATMRHLLAIANKGWEKALSDDIHLANGLNVCRGHVTHKAVADALGYTYVDIKKGLP